MAKEKRQQQYIVNYFTILVKKKRRKKKKMETILFREIFQVNNFQSKNGHIKKGLQYKGFPLDKLILRSDG